MAQKGVSLKPSDQIEGGGLLDNVDALFKEVRFEMFDYAGSSSFEVPALKITLLPDDGGEVDQFWSCGASKDWEPSKDGKSLVPIGDQKGGMHKSSNASIFFHHLVAAGFPEDKITDDVSVLEGLKAHMVRIPAPKRGGLPATKKREDGREYEKTILVVEKITKLPWEKVVKEGRKGAAPDDEAMVKASDAIMAVLAENPKGIEKMKLIGQVFTYLKKEKCSMELVNAATKLIREDAVEGPWSVDKGVYSM